MQGISLDQVEPLRILFGWFPTYKDSPMKTPFDRVLQIGDASGIQSPLSFGGFGAMARHLSRLRRAVLEALQVCLVPVTHSLTHPYIHGLIPPFMLMEKMDGWVLL